MTMSEESTLKQFTEEKAVELRKLLRLLTKSALSVRRAGRHGDWIDIRGTNAGKMFTHLEKVVVSDLMLRLGLQTHWTGFATIPPQLVDLSIKATREMVNDMKVQCV